MPGLNYCTDQGTLEINGVLLATPAFWCYDLWDLLLGADLRGNNTMLPLSPGVSPNPTRWTETTFDLPIAIAGEVDYAGNVYAEGSFIGFERNLWYLRENVVDPPPPPDPGRTAVFTTPDSREFTDIVQVLRMPRGVMVEGHDLISGSSGLAMKTVLRVRYPGGAPASETTPP